MLASVSSAGNSMLVFGGIDSKSSSKHNSVHVCYLNTLHWHGLETREGPAPAARSDASPASLACKRSCPSPKWRLWNENPLSAAAGTAVLAVPAWDELLLRSCRGSQWLIKIPIHGQLAVICHHVEMYSMPFHSKVTLDFTGEILMTERYQLPQRGAQCGAGHGAPAAASLRRQQHGA